MLSFVSTLWILAFLAVYGRPINVNHISFVSQVNRLETLLSEQNISLPLTEWVLKDVDKESTKSIIWTLDWLVQNYNKDKIINKIINFEYEDKYRSSRHNIREFLWADTDYDTYYPTYKYRDYYQHSSEKSINVSWYSNIYNFEKYYGDLENMTVKLKIDGQNYEFNLSNYADQLKEKADLQGKSSLSDEEKNTLQEPALIVEEENYKLVITSFYLEESNEWWDPKFERLNWYILFK